MAACVVVKALSPLMKRCSLFLIAASAMLLASCSSTSTQPPPATASKVDVKRYTGRWHEIARFPMSFQKADEKAYAEYGLNSDGTLSVHNVATAPDGSTRDIHGSAKVLNPGENSRLLVQFDAWFAVFIPKPEAGNYWILHVNADYSEALVGTPDRNFLWILARKPELDAKAYEALVEKARALGYDTERLIRPGQ